jgi:glycosyltransferase involved in cell wall biosynthesis
MRRERFVFVSTLTGYAWGGSEELWSRAAIELARQGFAVSASIEDAAPRHARVAELIDAGVDVWLRPSTYPLWRRAWRRLTHVTTASITAEVARLLRARPPSLVVLSDGGPFPWLDLPELCAAGRWRFATIGQANQESLWFVDEHSERFRSVLPKAQRCYFVSLANMRLAEKQIGAELPNAEIVRNPFNVDYDASLSWPVAADNGKLRLASVGRLEPDAKGQDLLIEALAHSPWAGRNWHLELFGEGRVRGVLERLVQRLGLSGKVTFAGHAAVSEIWRRNHVLVMPSRYEGLPLAMVEAMLCARPVVATDVAGHAEIVEDGVTGFLADAPTVASLSAALERLWRSRARLEEMGKAGGTRIRQLVPVDPARDFCEKLKALIHEVTERDALERERSRPAPCWEAANAPAFDPN